jgi:hypothetical protein
MLVATSLALFASGCSKNGATPAPDSAGERLPPKKKVEPAPTRTLDIHRDEREGKGAIPSHLAPGASVANVGECKELALTAEAVALFEKGCSRGDAEGCFRAGAAYLCGVGGGAPDVARAVDFSVRACDAGVAAACGNAGIMLEGTNGQKADLDRAQKLLEKGCNAGDVASCNNLGTLFIQPGPRQDIPRALAMMEKLCKANNVISCGNVAVLVFQGDGVPRDLVKADAFAKRACDANVTMGCNVLAALLMTGDGGEKADPAGAVTLFARSCDSGDASACANLGSAIMSGMAGTPDVPRAKTAFKTGCDLGNAYACTSLGTLLTQGHR